MFKGIIRPIQDLDSKQIIQIYSLYWDGDFLERISKRLKDTDELTYFVAEMNRVIAGVIGFRKAPLHMMEYTHTDNPAEIYILAVKNKMEGIGKTLVEKCLAEARNSGYKEIILYSGETHQDSWGFYDHLGFIVARPSIAPNGERGQIWRMELV